MKNKKIWISLITVISILINISGRYLTDTFSLPLWADSLGTLFSAYFLGPVSGAVVGAASDVIIGMGNIETLYYAIVAIGIGISAGYAARKGIFDSFFTSVSYASLLAIFAIIISTIVDIICLSGNTGNVWGDAVIKFFTERGMNRYAACLIGQFYIAFIDKVATVALFYLILMLYRYLKKKRRPVIKKNKQAAAAVLAIMLLLPVAGLITPAQAHQTDDFDSSVIRSFNESNGLTPGHATSIATTRDGMLWIGTYAGLYSYNGKTFEHFDAPEIKNVNCLYTDSEGRLWVGTNDSGLAIVINGTLANVIDEDNGLCSNSIRSIVQASNGNVYVGTTDYMQIVSLSNGISVVGELKKIINAGRSAVDNEEHAVCTGSNGNLYLIKEDRITDVIRPRGSKIFSSVDFGSDGKIYAGTTEGNIYIIDVRNDRLFEETEIRSEIGSVVNQIIPSDGDYLTVICDNGMYRVYSDGSRQLIGSDEFRYSLQSACYDYQGNLWVTSSRLGLMEVSPSAYKDIFNTYDISKRIVNAVMPVGNMIYVGCDDGLIIIDENRGRVIENNFTRALSGSRIRDLSIDSSGNIYAASYSKGLVSLGKNGKLKYYKGSNSPGLKTRTVLALNDGNVVASGDKGISFIRNGRAANLIPYGDELGGVSVLCITELSDGTLAVTTDGNGYFIISGEKVVKHYTRKDGLGSDVILKAVNTTKADTYFLVTSNGISVCEDGKIRNLNDFPYSNNYDIIETEDENCYVTGSAGIYITSLDDLLDNDGKEAMLSGTPEGLPYNLTVNSWNYHKGKYLYICGNEGIIRADTSKISYVDSTPRLFIKSVKAGGRSYQTDDDYDIVIPESAGKITITPLVINFDMIDPILSYKMNDGKGKWHDVSVSDLSDLTFSGLKAGRYTLQMAVRDSTGNTLEENSFTFSVSEELYERAVFKAYLIIVILIFIGWVTWFFTHLFLVTRARQTEAALEIAKKQVEMGNESVLAMAKALFSKDRRTGEHCHRVAYYAQKLAKAYGFSDKDTRNLKKAALLHDIGKIAIPDSVLNKPARLTDEEYAVMKTHTTAGAEILKGFTIVDHVSEGARYHHERYDGKGYPEGIFGENIPLYGRIIAVADTFDAMTANRVYRGALDMDHVMQELKDGRGTQFDPYLDDLFMDLIEKGEIDPKKTFEKFRGRDLTEDIE